MADSFDAMARELAALADPREDECEAGYFCHFHPVYGFVPEADCPVHDVRDTLGEQRATSEPETPQSRGRE